MESGIYISINFLPLATTCEVPSDSPSTVIPQAALEGALGVSLVINTILVVTVVALLVKIRDLQYPSSSRREEALDIEIKPNSVYGLASENIVTKPNEVYGVATATTDGVNRRPMRL